MPKFETVRRVPFSQTTMYEIVADIERYPEFLPLCEKLVIIEGPEQEEGEKQILKADMTVAYHKLQETFRSKVILDASTSRITTTNINGPFKHLENSWHFVPITETSCDVHFSIDYAFKNWALEKLIGGMFEKAFRTYAQSFEERANTLTKNKS